MSKIIPSMPGDNRLRFKMHYLAQSTILNLNLIMFLTSEKWKHVLDVF